MKRNENSSILTCFLAQVKKTKTCWLWQGRISRRYGRFAEDGQFAAHRWAFQYFVGPIPEGLLVCHRCDVNLCVNPAHLFLGTQLDNQRDKWKKGRGVIHSGKQHWAYGKPAWNRGRPWSKTIKAKISARSKGRILTLEHRAAIGRGLLGNSNTLGHKLTKAHKRKISLSQKGIPKTRVKFEIFNVENAKGGRKK
jgi:HNH endonuclease/NUMOD3 motif